jgi:hypothetical protein
MKKFESRKRTYYQVNKEIYTFIKGKLVKGQKLPKNAEEYPFDDKEHILSLLNKEPKKTTLVQCRINEVHACELRDLIKNFKKSIK